MVQIIKANGTIYKKIICYLIKINIYAIYNGRNQEKF